MNFATLRFLAVFGAALGGLPAFVFTGFAVLIGAAAVLGGSSFDFISNVAFGPVFGPSLLLWWCAAAAYAAKKAYICWKDIVSGGAGFNDPMALLIGGLFVF